MVPGYPAITTASSEPMSMPEFERVGGHHGADVAGAQAALNFAALAGQIAAAIAAHAFGGNAAVVAGVLQIGDQDFGGQAVVGEDQSLLVAVDEFERDAARLVDVAAADAELAVDHRRVVEDEVLFAGGRAVAVDRVRTARR